jgi:hypothetical protein
MKHVRTSLITLAGTAALASSFAAGSTPALAASGRTPTSATQPASAKALTERPRVTPDQVEVCIGVADQPELNFYDTAITSAAYIYDCTARPVSCTVSAHLQAKSADTGGNWTNIAIGPNESGCTSANASIVSEPCQPSAIEWTYRTEGYYKVVWPDGGIDDDHNVSDEVSAKFECSPEDLPTG